MYVGVIVCLAPKHINVNLLVATPLQKNKPNTKAVTFGVKIPELKLCHAFGVITKLRVLINTDAVINVVLKVPEIFFLLWIGANNNK